MRTEPLIRKQMILVAAVRAARRSGGWNTLTRARIAKEANCAPSLVTLYLGDMQELRETVMKSGIRHGYHDLIAQGIAAGYPMCLKLSPVLKHKAINCLMGE